MTTNWTARLKGTLKETLSFDGTNSLLLAADTADYRTFAEVTLLVDGTADNVINGTESTAVTFTVSGLGPSATAKVTFSDASNHQIVVDVGGNGTFSANLSGLTDGTITSLLSATAPNGSVTTATGNSVSLDTDSSLSPTLSVNAANPADVTFTVSGLESDYSGTVTFTDSTGKSDVVPIGSNGTYSANLSNLTNGTLTYLLTASDPAGNVITVDPTATLGPTGYNDGSAHAPAGTPQLASLLSGYAVRPPWEVAGVDYAVGTPSGTVLKDPATINMVGVTVHMGGAGGNWLGVTGNNVVLNGYDFSLEGGWEVYVTGNNATIENSYFLTQSTAQTPIYFAASAVGGTVEYNTIDGNNGANGSLTLGWPPLEIIGGGGTFTVEYNYIKNVFSDGINIGGNSVTETFNIEYNVLQNMGDNPSQNSHPDFIQTQTNGTIFNNLVIDFNTLYQPSAPLNGGTQGITAFDHVGPNPTFINPDVSYNTLIAAPVTGLTSTTEGVDPWISLEQTEISGTGYVTNNYVDPSGNVGTNGVPGQFLVADNGTGSLNGTVATSNNVNMLTGAQLIPQSFISVSNVVSSPSSGAEFPGNTITFTLDFSGPVTVTGTPTLTLNDGGTATYAGGSGTSALAFSYTVSSSDSTVSALAITQVNLPNGAAINGAGNVANLSGALTTFPGLQINTTTPQTGPQINTTVGAWSNLSFPTQTTAFTASFDATPSQLGSDIVIGLSPTTAAAYTDLAAIVRFNSSDTIDVRNGSAYGANVSVPYSAGTSYHFVMVVNPTTDTYSVYVTPQGGSQIALATNYAFRTEQATDTSLSDVGEYSTAGSAPVLNFSITPASAPTVTSVATSGRGISNGTGDLNAGHTVTFTVAMSGNVTVNTTGGTPTLSLNDLGTATYQSGSGTSALTFTYTVAAGQNTSDLAVTAFNLNGATITDGAGNAATMTGVVTNPAGILQIDTTAPAPPIIANHTVNRNHTVTLTGTAEANSTVSVYDNGSKLLGTTKASASGAWTYTTPRLPHGTNIFTATATDAAGNTSGLSNAMDPVIGPNNISSLTVNNGAIVDLSGSSAAAVTFAGSSGTLQLDHPAGFSGTISGFAGQDQIDLTSVAFSSNTTLGYLPNAGNLGGTLSVSDGVHNVSLALLGQYIASSFVTASDGHGGTLVIEQPSNSTISLAHPHAPA
jgi:large repetitive protein